jgi:hypothetical protein
MSIFKRRKIPQTKIVRRGGETISAGTPRPDFGVTLNTSPRWEVKRGEFHGFGSPPGKF